MYKSADHPYRAPFDGSFRIADWSTDKPEDAPRSEEREARLSAAVEEMKSLQRRLYAQDQWSLLLVFQAMDAAGKDGTIRAVMSGVNPAGCEVHSFKQPSAEELDHDFLWRTACRLPQRGRMGIFNRSYYEEVLVVRVHPEYLGAQRLPFGTDDLEGLWASRYRSIRDHERHLADNGTVILKFFLNLGKDEQRDRFLARIDEPEKNWKFSSGDVRERQHWDAYQQAYEHAIAETSRPWAPWYCIPANNKSYMRMAVAEIIVSTMRGMNMAYPTLAADERAKLLAMRDFLASDG